MIDLGNRGNERGKLTGRMLIVLAALMWSTSALFAKAPLLSEWPLEVRGPLLAFWRTLFGGVVLFALARTRCWDWRLIPSGICFAAMNITFLQTMTRTTGANAIWLQYTALFWVVLAGVSLFREKLTRRDILVVALGMAGVGVIVAFELRDVARVGNRAGMAWGMVSGVTYAGVILTARALRDLDATWMVACNHLITAAVLFPFVLGSGVDMKGIQIGWVALFGVFQLAIPYVLFSQGVKTVPANKASVIALLEPLMVPVWVFLAWRHHPTYAAPDWWTFLGGGLILSGLLLRFVRYEPVGDTE